ncbi:hypothetical protein [Sphingosinithalassobacter sp. CS137]|uniref:hypothetical protein n=1 Tax=Sphingosinithalassobacter sp. CS137 TaxID=2762748 RepID=UPI00165DCD26|nr:hypothetical protein [Sphingosinithalassobacter sp. CS137]
MFGTPKSAASLSSGLLARKGQARPAMRPQGFVGLGPNAAEDLGWNDMGEDTVPEPAPEPVASQKPPVLRQREALDRELAISPSAPEPTAAPDSARLTPGTLARVQREVRRKKSRTAFTLRLDSDRHLRLRLASAVSNRSAQQLVTEALDAFLETQPGVEELVRQLGSSDGR